MNNNPIYRFKFDESFAEKLYSFSKIHQFDDRKTYKEEWEKWCEMNDEIIIYEERRLSSLGYQGNIKDKMYKSGRYYFRKKTTEKKEPIKRRTYTGLSKEILEAMDKHINSSNFNKQKPSEDYDKFIIINKELINNETEHLKEIMTNEEIINKIKKTFKNRYFININNYKIN